ncbi:MAG: PilZ domain-containing protein [Syntrophales bacterium LBB04]|nr:PilZ domain-containing protein [Syntrophales bacterium LBB04]
MYSNVNDNEAHRGAIGKVIFLEDRQGIDTTLPPWIFHHEDLIGALASAGAIDKKKLANTLNYIHFKGGHIDVLLQHPHYEEGLLVRAYPEPCLGDELTCDWDRAYSGHKLERYYFHYLIIAHDQSIIVVPAQLLTNSSEKFVLKLPESGHIISDRLNPRFACHGVEAELWQNGFQAEGDLMDFSPHAFRIRVQPLPPSSFHWFNAEVPCTIRLSNDKDIFFSGNCTCINQKQNNRSREIVLSPVDDQIKRFRPKVLRNPRHRMSPALNAVFEHPFSKKKIQREIYDISTSGFSIRDKSYEVVLMPGMIIPDVNVIYAGIIKIHCRVQVIYRKEEDSQICFGISILDMDLINYNNLTHLLNSIPGADAGMTGEIDCDALWELFFDVDFIYPKKYEHIHAFRDDFQATYRKLYEDAPAIAKHFSYQKNGRIHSHVSMLRAYERAWMIHHHAARPLDGKTTGFIVLKQLIYYLNDAHRLPSANMDHVFCYFRPENKFDDRLYTGFTKGQDNAQVTSLDLFGYITYDKDNSSAPLPSDWSLRECLSSDIWELEQYYRHCSGGLFLDLLDLHHQNQGQSLEKIYAEMGFIRKYEAFALHYLNDLKAVIIAEESDVAVNLSDLLNGFKVLIMDPDMPSDVLFAAIGDMAKKYSGKSSLPLMIYPAAYAQNNSLNFEKQYYLWVLNLQHANEYMRYLGRLFRMRFD